MLEVEIEDCREVDKRYKRFLRSCRTLDFCTSTRLAQIKQLCEQVEARLSDEDVSCLQKAYICVNYLQNKGVLEAYIQIGVKVCPFEAHAWVEYAGEVVFGSKTDYIPLR
jgi:hypothetical protein